jgi:hypothetical protein
MITHAIERLKEAAREIGTVQMVIERKPSHARTSDEEDQRRTLNRWRRLIFQSLDELAAPVPAQLPTALPASPERKDEP